MIDLRRAADRPVTHGPGLTSRHSFSFGRHYDPHDVGLSSLVAHNEDVLSPGAGYDPHPHADLEIVTWVLEGSLVHTDSTGHRDVLVPGTVRRLSAGSGVRHSERNDAPGAGPTRFVQAWLRPDESGTAPDVAVSRAPLGAGLVPLVSGVRGLDAPVTIATTGAAFYTARLEPGQDAVDLPDGPRLHVFVARGTVRVAGAGPLGPGDAVRLDGPDADGGPPVTADVSAGGTAEVLVWRLP